MQKIQKYVNTLFRKDGILNTAIIRRDWFKNSPEYKEILKVTDWIFKIPNSERLIPYGIKTRILLIKNNIFSVDDLPKCLVCGNPVLPTERFNFSKLCSRKCGKKFNENSRQETYLKNKSQKIQNEIMLDFDEMLNIINEYVISHKDVNLSEDTRLNLGVNKTFLHYASKLPEKYQKLNPNRILLVFNNNNAIPKCKNSNCNNLVNVGSHGFRAYCSKKCKETDTTYIEKLSNSIKENYNQNKAEIIKKKVKNSVVNWGKEYPQQSQVVQNKIKQTCINKYGVEYYSQTNESKEKSKQTCLNKYGVEHYLQTNEFKEKSKQTCINKYGVEHYSHLGLTNGYKWYDYTLPSGKVIKYQGYENRYIPVLIRKYGEENIVFEKSKVPKIPYFLDGKKHYYFPDFYIPSENLIVEIKSKYTLNTDLTKNNAKFEAVKTSGYNFKLKIF